MLETKDTTEHNIKLLYITLVLKEIKTGYLFVRNMTILRFANGLLWSLIFVSVNYVDSQEKKGELQGKTIVFKYYVKQYLNKKPSNDSF